MVNHYSYLIPKDEVLALCKRAILKLDYDIDIYAPESNILITKSRKIRKVLRRYDYVIYIQVGDKVNVHISANKNIFNSVDSISAELNELYLDNLVAVCLIEITINKEEVLKVIDVIKFNDEMKIIEVSAYKQ